MTGHCIHVVIAEVVRVVEELLGVEDETVGEGLVQTTIVAAIVSSCSTIPRIIGIVGIVVEVDEEVQVFIEEYLSI